MYRRNCALTNATSKSGECIAHNCARTDSQRSHQKRRIHPTPRAQTDKDNTASRDCIFTIVRADTQRSHHKRRMHRHNCARTSTQRSYHKQRMYHNNCAHTHTQRRNHKQKYFNIGLVISLNGTNVLPPKRNCAIGLQPIVTIVRPRAHRSHHKQNTYRHNCARINTQRSHHKQSTYRRKCARTDTTIRSGAYIATIVRARTDNDYSRSEEYIATPRAQTDKDHTASRECIVTIARADAQ